jgi:hypothetical protein
VGLKTPEEVMEILEAFDATGSLRAAAELAGCDHKTVGHWVRARDAAGGGLPAPVRARPRVDAFAEKIDEWVKRSRGRIRADVAHRKLVAMGYHAPGGRGGQAALAGGPRPPHEAMDHRAWAVDAVGLRNRARDRGTEHPQRPIHGHHDRRQRLVLERDHHPKPAPSQPRAKQRRRVAVARHYGFTIETCVPADPQSKALVS